MTPIQMMLNISETPVEDQISMTGSITQALCNNRHRILLQDTTLTQLRILTRHMPPLIKILGVLANSLEELSLTSTSSMRVTAATTTRTITTPRSSSSSSSNNLIYRLTLKGITISITTTIIDMQTTQSATTTTIWKRVLINQEDSNLRHLIATHSGGTTIDRCQEDTCSSRHSTIIIKTRGTTIKEVGQITQYPHMITHEAINNSHHYHHRLATWTEMDGMIETARLGNL